MRDYREFSIVSNLLKVSAALSDSIYMEIIVVEDCIDTYYLIEKSLFPYKTIHALSISEAQSFLSTTTPDLFLIDVDLPDGDGIDFCSKISTSPKFMHVPKIILTTYSDVSKKVFGLYSGADDYVTKPFSSQELKARCEVRLKRFIKQTEVTIGSFTFNKDFQYVSTLDDQGRKTRIELTPTEFKIFYALASNKNRALTRQEIVRKIWSQNGMTIELRGLDTHVSHLRKKLGDDAHCIRSVYGKGYSFQEN